jgi:glc operon protein GlcG
MQVIVSGIIFNNPQQESRSLIKWIALQKFARTQEREEQAMPSRMIKILAVLTLAFCALGTEAQMLPNPYGPPISIADAKKAAAAALAEAVKNHWIMAVAVVDPTGTLVYYEKSDNTQIGSANVSINKARSAALYKRPTKAFQDALAGGGAGLRVLGLEGAVPVEGGVPIISDGKIIGAIGVSGANSDQDGQCALAGAAAIK